jgi:hypothetical protein
MGPVVGRIREIEFRLDADFHAFNLALALDGPGSRSLAGFLTRETRLFVKGQARLGLVQAETSASRSVLVQAPRYFAPPFWF